ncbi:MAG: AI-2E family transporter [Rhodococcus sp. (in: high G+C Gram-positive bacteria)]|uniref:AI-2E family transporter n=1 Tax=Rhodococcus sp. TaxID=1831 RepID=UPI003BB02548
MSDDGERAATPPRRGLLSEAPRWLRPAVVYVLLAVAFFQVAGWLFDKLADFIGLLFLAWLFGITVEPVVDRLERRGLRRGLAAGLVLVGLVLFAVGFIALFGTLLVEQLGELLQALPGALSDITSWANRSFGTDFETGDDMLRLTPDNIRELTERFMPGALAVVSSLVGLVFQAMTLLLFAFYMSAQGPALRRTVSSWFPARQQRIISTVWEISVDKAGGYVVSRLVLAAVSSVVFGVFLMAIGVPYWLPLALWTGVVSQFIPTLGTYLAIGLPAVIAATAQPIDALWVVAFGTAYQQVENYILHPKITARTVSIHPAVAFGSVIAGAALFGAVGALVSVPVVAAVQAVVETYGHRYEFVGDSEPGESTADEGGGAD